MKKNVAGQSIGIQMVTAADGTAFTGSVAVEVTIDGGTQTTGGATVSEGNGYHSYAPTQSETNGDHIAFTFTGTGAIPATVQVYTGFPQTVDNNVILSGLNDFDPATDAVANVTLVDTTTTNTDMLTVTDILTTQMSEAYAADGVAPTLAQAIFLIQQTIGDFSIAGTTITAKRLNGTTTAATYTLDDGTSPTSRTRAT